MSTKIIESLFKVAGSKCITGGKYSLFNFSQFWRKKELKTEKMKTISGKQINVKANNSKRTYTIRTEHSKYRTYPMSKEEFESAYYWTGNDWNNYLKTNDYYLVK